MWAGGVQEKTMQGSAEGLVGVELMHLRCTAGALAQRVNKGSGSSPNTRGSARPAAGDAKSTASGASTGRYPTCMLCYTQLACWQPPHSLVRCQQTLIAPNLPDMHQIEWVQGFSWLQ